MTFRPKHLCILFFLVFTFARNLHAQEPLNRNWDSEKIKGVRYILYSSYHGFPFLNNNWDLGKIEFTDGEIMDSLRLRYSSYKDELVYFNTENNSQIIIDKATLKGFSFIDSDGIKHIFTKLPFDDYLKGDHYFEILSDGEPKLLSFRKVVLTSTTPYKDADDVPLKNMEYSPAYQYYFYSTEKKFTSVRLSRTGLFAKFDRPAQKQIKKLLRKNRIKITNETSFIQAWEIIKGNGFQVHF